MGPFWHGSYRCYALVGPPGGPPSDATESHEDCRGRTIATEWADTLLSVASPNSPRCSFRAARDASDPLFPLPNISTCFNFSFQIHRRLESAFKSTLIYIISRTPTIWMQSIVSLGISCGCRSLLKEKKNYRIRYKHGREYIIHSLSYFAIRLIRMTRVKINTDTVSLNWYLL